MPHEFFDQKGKTPALVISEPQTSIAELFAKDTVLFAQVFDHLKLAFIHPSGKGDQEKPERIEDCGHVLALLSTGATSRPAGQQRRFKKIQFSGHTGSKWMPVVFGVGYRHMPPN